MHIIRVLNLKMPYSRTSENVRIFEVGDLVLLISIPNQKIVLSYKYIEIFLHIFIFSPVISVLILKSLERNLFI